MKIQKKILFLEKTCRQIKGNNGLYLVEKRVLSRDRKRTNGIIIVK